MSDVRKQADELGLTYGDTSQAEADYRMAVLAQRNREKEAECLNRIKAELRERMSNT